MFMDVHMEFNVISTNHVDFIIALNSADCYDGSWIFLYTNKLLDFTKKNSESYMMSGFT